MSDIFREVAEDLRRDQLMSFWKRYGTAVVTGAVLIVAGTGAYVGWKHWRASQMEERTLVLSRALDLARPAEGQTLDPKAAADALAKAATELGAGHAVLARLYEAGLRSRDGQYDQAVALYDQVAGSGEVDPVLRDLAQLLSVQLQVDKGDITALRGRLEPLMASGNVWRASATELAAVLAIRAGDTAQAGTLFRSLADDAQTPQGIRARATELAALYAAPK